MVICGCMAKHTFAVDAAAEAPKTMPDTGVKTHLYSQRQAFLQEGGCSMAHWGREASTYQRASVAGDPMRLT
jgi:hypothetical protein